VKLTELHLIASLALVARWADALKVVPSDHAFAIVLTRVFSASVVRLNSLENSRRFEDDIPKWRWNLEKF
jgi:hypothetical protein